MKYCPFCHAQLNDTAAFCGMCGSKLESFVQNEPPMQATQPYRPVDTQNANPYTPYTEPAPQPTSNLDSFGGFDSQPVNQNDPFADFDSRPINQSDSFSGFDSALINGDAPAFKAEPANYGTVYAQPANSETVYAEPLYQNGPQNMPAPPEPLYQNGPQNMPAPPEPYYPAAGAGIQRSPLTNTAIETIRRNCRSILVVIIAVLLTINVVANLLSAFDRFDNQDYVATDFVNDKMDEIDDELNDQIAENEKKASKYKGYKEYEQVEKYKKSVKKDIKSVKNSIQDYFSTYYSYFALVNQVGIATMALVAAIAFWFLFASSSQKSPYMKTGGLSALKGVGTTHMVFFCFFGAAAIAIVGTLHFFSSKIFSWAINQLEKISNFVIGKTALKVLNISPEKIESFLTSSKPTVIFIVSYIVLALVTLLLIVFAARLISSVNKIQNSLDPQNPPSNISAFAAVMLFIFGILSLAGLFNIKNTYDLLATLTGAGYRFSIGAWIFKYRSSMAPIVKASKR